MKMNPYDKYTAISTSEVVPHNRIEGVGTYLFIQNWQRLPVSLEMPHIRLNIHGFDFLYKDNRFGHSRSPLKFQQKAFKIWYQIGGTGILQNATRNMFGTARQGLLGIMNPGERHTYLHQKDTLECFIMDFDLQPAGESKCYWNAETEGKLVLDEKKRGYFEDIIFDILLAISGKVDREQFFVASKLTEIISFLFTERLLVVEEEQFPKNKAKRLVEMVKNFIHSNYSTIRHQSAIAQRCKTDINYLNILFKKEIGQTLYQYLTTVRMEHAKYMLENSTVSVNSIATAIGYPNSNSFTRVFRKKFSLTPTEYREKSK